MNKALFSFAMLISTMVSAQADHAHAATADEGGFEPSVTMHFGGDLVAGKFFGDAPEPNAFHLGVIDTMVHGRLSRSITVMTELVYEESGAGFGFDLERVQVNYEPRTWFRLSAGRVHTPLGYWNTAFHHARWMYASIEAPLLNRFEDGNGPLQTHTVGALAHGTIPVAGLRLEYDLGVGNGRGRTPDPVQQFTDVNEGKAVIAGVHVGIGGLRVGVSGLVDATTTEAGVDMAEQIGMADVHWKTGPLELLAEGALVRHDFTGAGVANNYGGYVQAVFSARDDVHLYGRVERFVRAPEEVFLTTPSTSNALGGIRWDAEASASIKIEGGWERVAGIDVGSVRGQVSWLF